MTSSKKEKKAFEKLVSLGPERLARMLIERADWDEGTARTVEQALAESDPVKAVAGKVRKELARYTESQLKGAWHKSSVISRELDHLRVLISESILLKSPTTAAAQLEKLIDRHEPVFNNVDDSNGYLGDVFRQAVRDWGYAWAKIPDKKSKSLANMVFKKIGANDYGMYDSIVPAFGAALGESGIAALERLVRQEISHFPPAQPDEDLRQISENGFRRGRLCHALEEIADLRNDPDGYVEAISLRGMTEAYAGDIAERLINAKRFEEALEWLDRGGRLPRHDAADLKAQCLIALGRKDEARQLLWKDFIETLSDSSYSGAMKLAASEDAAMLKQAAVETALRHGSALTALSFLLKQKYLSDAAALVMDRWAELDGQHYYTIRPAAEKFEIGFPLASVLLRRRLVEAILEKGNSKHYRYAVDDLKQAERVSSMVQDWRGIDDHERYLELLRGWHGKKNAFWSCYAESGGWKGLK